MKMYPIQSTKYIYSLDLYGIYENRESEDQEIIDFFQRQADSQKKEYESNVRAWRTDWNAHLAYPILKGLIKDITNTIVSLNHPYMENDLSNIILKDSWVNVQKGNSADFVEPHYHGNLNISFTYYLKSDENSSPLRAHSASAPTFSGMQIISKTKINTKSGELLLFDPEMFHDVVPSISDRIVFAGNILFHENLSKYSVNLMEFLNEA